eukprot:8435259-Alexandrium_andersonii.AAC.1
MTPQQEGALPELDRKKEFREVNQLMDDPTEHADTARDTLVVHKPGDTRGLTGLLGGEPPAGIGGEGGGAGLASVGVEAPGSGA